MLAACAIAGVEEVYAVGGAQAIAALAYGTESIDAGRRDRRPGQPLRRPRPSARSPGAVGIDGIAGPSELVIVADGTATAERDRARPLRPGRARRRQPAGAGLARRGAARPGRRAGHRARRRAPERRRRAAGAGHRARASSARSGSPTRSRRSTSSSPSTAPTRPAPAAGSPAASSSAPAGATAFGDYAAGSNHVLPTGGAARFGGPLGPGAFMRRTLGRLHRLVRRRENWRPTSPRSPRAEGFPVHGESATARAKR